MDETAVATPLSRQEASDAVGDLGWRFLLGSLRTHVRASSMSSAAVVAARVVAGVGLDVDQHVRVDIRSDRVVFTVQTLSAGRVTSRDADIATWISTFIAGQGLRTSPDTDGEQPRSVQALEIAIDAMDIAAVLPFWQAVMGYQDESDDAVVDPLGQHPTIWFQQMDQPRPQRNRIHLDVTVPHDEAQGRIKRAVAAGGVLRSDAEAPAFWVLADVEGNEACITTWQGRD